MDRSEKSSRINAINQWYDRRMFTPRNAAHGGFQNYGYWDGSTGSWKEACENLMEHLLAFLPEKRGTILDVACGKGATTRYLLNFYKPENVAAGINISLKQLKSLRGECLRVHLRSNGRRRTGVQRWLV